MKCIEGYHKSLLVKVPPFCPQTKSERPERCYLIRGDSLARKAVVARFLASQVKKEVAPME
ncbi:MAG TPA: hypothetical protein VGA95_04975 [Thermodesulfobacteriota bacterium]